MAKKELTKHERVVAAIVGQTLRAMNKNHITVTEILTAALKKKIPALSVLYGNQFMRSGGI